MRFFVCLIEFNKSIVGFITEQFEIICTFDLNIIILCGLWDTLFVLSDKNIILLQFKVNQIQINLIEYNNELIIDISCLLSVRL